MREIPDIRRLILLNKRRPLSRVIIFKLEVPSMISRAQLPPLDKNEYRRSNDRNKVQRQPHQVADQRLGCKLAERLLHCLPQPPQNIIGRVQFSPILHKRGQVLLQQHRVEYVDQRFVNQE